MATRVEISSALASLTTVPDLKEIRSEDKSQCVYVSVLSDASNKAKEAAASLTLEEKNKLGSPLRSATMPSLGSRPRLFPKPFSKEKSSETFANVKPPVPAFRSSSLIRRAAEETSSVRVLSGNVPPLLDQKAIEKESKAGGDVVTNMTFYTGPSANTVILFEAATEQPKVSLAQEKRAADEHRGFGSLQTKELQCSTKLEKPSQPPEASRRPEGSLHRQISLSSSVRPASWTPPKTSDKKDACEGHPGGKKNDDTTNSNSKAEFSLAVQQQRPKPRPVSAIFLDSLRDPKPCPVEASEEKSPTEKAWVRKPRPLSMDLTAKFELKDFSSCKKPCSSHESKENVSITSAADLGSHDQAETGPKPEGTEFTKGSSSKGNLKGSSQDLGILSNGKYSWETKLKSKSEQTEAAPGVNLQSSERSRESPREEGKRQAQREGCSFPGSQSPAASSEKESSIVRGSVKKHIHLFASETPSLPGDAEGLQAESRSVSIQQRIKELTTENPDGKPGNPRRSLLSRPLSADKTKMFSSPTSPGEAKPEKSAETRNEPVHEVQESQKSKEMQLAHGTDPTEASAAGSSWKPRQVLKITNKPDQLERKGSFLGDGQHFAQQSESSVSFTSNLEKKLKPTTPMEKTCIKTVRATIFDHNVQRYNVAAEHPGTDPVPKMNNETKQDVVTLGHNRRSWMGGVEETISIKKEYQKQPDSSKPVADVEQSGKSASSGGDKKITPGILLEKSLVQPSENPSPKAAEESPVLQRIEPRYEIFQTCGERALSEAITMAPEKKAMTLRARKSSVKENKSNEDVLHTGQPARTSSKTLYLKDDNIISEARDTKGFTSQSVLKELADSECTSPEQKKYSDKTETDPITLAEKIAYSTNKSKYLGMTEEVNKLHSEMRNGESEISLDKMERSGVMKCSAEKRSFRAGGTDGCEFRANFDHEVSSTSVNKLGVQCSSVLSSGQFGKSSSSHHPDTQVLTIKKEESRAFALRRTLDFNCKDQDFSLDTTAHESSGKIRVTDPEEKIRRTRSNVSDLKISERWRRRTLPQDSVKTEEVVWLSPENIKRLSRTDSLQLDESSIKKRSKKLRGGLEGNEGNQTVLGSPADYLKNQSSVFEPKATYFAVTYQIPGIKKEKSFVGSPSAGETNPVPSSSEGAADNLDCAFPGRSKPSLQQPNKSMTSTNCREGSREGQMNKDGGKNESKDGILSKNVACSNFHVSRKDNQQYHERGLDHSKEKIIDVDALLLKQNLESTAQTDLKSSRRKASSFHEPRAPLRFAQSQKDSELIPQKCSEKNYDFPGKKAEDGYRSQILDIDALMAEYKEEAVKSSNIQDRLSEDPTLLSREKSSKNKRNVPDRGTSSYSWNEWKGSDHHSVANKQGDNAAEHQKPEKLILNEKSKEKLESCGTESDKQKSKDRKFSPPYWGNPSSLFPEQLVNAPVDFSRKKTFIVDEDEEVNLTSRNQGLKFVIEKVQPVKADQKLEINLAAKLSSKADDVLLQKKVVPKEQGLEVSPEGDWSKNVVRRSKETVNKVVCVNDPSSVRGRADWRNSSPGVGSAAPDLRRCYSEKIRQGKDNFPLVQEAWGRKELSCGRQSFPLESTENGWKHKMPAQSEPFFHEETKASRKEWSKQSAERREGTDLWLVSALRSRHSFWKEQRAEKGTVPWDKDQLKQCFSRQPPGAKDTDTLVQEPDNHYGTWSQQRHSGDSFVPESPSSENDGISTRKQPPNSHPSSLSSQTEPASLVDHHDFSKDQRSTSLDRSSTDMDSTDGTDLPPPGDTYPEEKATDFSFIDQTTVLDSSALKNRVQLSKKRRRRAPGPTSLRRSRGLELENRFSLTEEPDNTWMFKDSTEEKKTMQQEDSEEEEKSQHTARSPAVQAQRLPLFPGMDHSVLKAQLRKRQESESAGDVGSAQQFKSPKAALQLGPAGGRVLPSSVEKEERSEEKSPQWLKELKSKKRQSHYENQL
ncbi:uncharacterized protein KIAA1671 homolog isoform X2 [Calypte anna]|uniref:uncharacterized protein KIAA1671 homolog isoform X2 n=1 Tax=Calypte anna TaxID=9244 RepID=UPI0011C37C6F|nr:uncharacterized protein KIAA1671 homolog isoform X2 [Calypte anna]